MEPYTYSNRDRDWSATGYEPQPHDTAPMPRVEQEAVRRRNAVESRQAPAQPNPYDDYQEYFYGEGTQVEPRRRSGCATVLAILVAVALATMLWPQSPVNYDVLRGTSLDQLQDWFYTTFGIEPPEPSQEELEAIYGQSARAETGYLAIEPPTELTTLAQAQHYYRSCLDEHAQAVYDALEEGLVETSEHITMPAGTTSDELQSVWQFVLYDHPEVFNLANDAHITYWSWNGHVTHLAPDYKYSGEKAAAMSQEYASLALELPLLAETQEGTMENICAYVADTADYQSTGNDQYIDSVFTDHASVCAGYAKAVQYLALRHGIPCIYITGTAADFLGTGGNHAWLAAYVDGEIRYYDPTWYDQRGWHATQYLGMNLLEISADHEAAYPQLLPR